MAVLDGLQFILDGNGLGIQALFLDNIVKWGIHIKLEPAHDHQVVPQLVLVIGLAAQLGEHVGHVLHDGERATSALGAVFNRQAVVNHLLDVAAVLGQHQFLEL